MLNKAYVKESADLLLQNEGCYPISPKEFAQFCRKNTDFVCFVLDNFPLEDFRVYYCYEKYCHIKEVMYYRNSRQDFVTHFRHDNKNKRHIVVNNILKNFRSKNLELFFDVKTTFDLYSQRMNCVTANIDYACQSAEKRYLDILTMLNPINCCLMKYQYLEANYGFLEDCIMPYSNRTHDKICAKNYEKFILKLEKYLTCNSENFGHYQKRIQCYFAQLKQANLMLADKGSFHP
jgi:hypothetical protein